MQKEQAKTQRAQDAAHRPSSGRSPRYRGSPGSHRPPLPSAPSRRGGSAGAGPSRAGGGATGLGGVASAPRPRRGAHVERRPARTPTWRLRHGIGGEGREVGGARTRCALWLVGGAVNPRASPRAVLRLRGALGLGRLRPLTPAEGRGGEERGKVGAPRFVAQGAWLRGGPVARFMSLWLSRGCSCRPSSRLAVLSSPVRGASGW